MVHFPMRPLTVLTAVDYSAAPNANHELTGTFTAFGRETVTADIVTGSRALLAFHFGHRVKIFQTGGMVYWVRESLIKSNDLFESFD